MQPQPVIQPKPYGQAPGAIYGAGPRPQIGAPGAIYGAGPQIGAPGAIYGAGPQIGAPGAVYGAGPIGNGLAGGLPPQVTQSIAPQKKPEPKPSQPFKFMSIPDDF